MLAVSIMFQIVAGMFVFKGVAYAGTETKEFDAFIAFSVIKKCVDDAKIADDEYETAKWATDNDVHYTTFDGWKSMS